MLKNIQEIIPRKIQPDFQKYSTYIIISIFLGIALKTMIWNHEVIDDFIFSTDQLLNISSNSSIDHRLTSSTCAAILSTVFTIIFVLLTVFIQMSGAHTSEDVLQSDETKKLMILYFATIVFSLMMLETTFQFPIIVLTLTFACILSLYPFLCAISSKFQYEVGVGKLSEEIYSLIDANNESLALGRIGSLAGICKRSIKDNKLKVFMSIMPIFESSIKKAKQKEMADFVTLTGLDYLAFLSYLTNNKLTTNQRRTMFMLLFREINEYIDSCSYILKCDDLDIQTFLLKDEGMNMIKAGFDGKYVNRIFETLVHIFNDVQKKRDMKNEIKYLNHDLEPHIVEYIGELTTELYIRQGELSSLVKSVEAFLAIGAKACQVNEVAGNSGSSTPFFVVTELKKIEDNIGANNFEKLIANPKKYIAREPELEPYLDKFKEYYHEQKAYI